MHKQRKYVDLIVKALEENPEMSFPGGAECQIETPKGEDVFDGCG